MVTSVGPAPHVDSAQVVVFPPVVGAVLLGVALGLHVAFPLTLLSSWWLAAAIGLAPLAVGIGIQVVAIRTLLRAATTPLFRPSTVVVQHGLYGISRNPIYLAVLVQVAALALVFNTAWMLALPPVLFLYFHFWVIPREEAYLERAFGEAYLAYTSSVRRWL